MSHAPWALFWAKRGLMPDDGLPIFPVSRARLARCTYVIAAWGTEGKFRPVDNGGRAIGGVCSRRFDDALSAGTPEICSAILNGNALSDSLERVKTLATFRNEGRVKEPLVNNDA